MTAVCVPYRGVAGVCDRCGEALPPRRRRWCGEGCRDAYWADHDWGLARAACLRRDQWTCVRCGRVGWADVPRDVLRLESHHRVTGTPASGEHWALVAGLLEPSDLVDPPGADWAGTRAHTEHRRRAVAQLPDSVRTLVDTERRAAYRMGRRGRFSHDLEVNHVNPRRGKGYAAGCHNHQDNLETLCRACHADETARQRRERRPEREAAWRDGYEHAHAGLMPPRVLIPGGGGYHPDSLEVRYDGSRELVDAWMRGYRKGRATRPAQPALPLEAS